MPRPLNIARIDCSAEDARQALARVRERLSPRGDVVSPEGRARTIAAFGEPLSPQQVVERICQDVRERGLAAVLDYTRKLDGKDLRPEEVRVSLDEMAAAYRKVDRDYIGTIRRIRDNIVTFQAGILHRTATLRKAPGIELKLRYLPLKRVGVCVPGGAAAYPSSLLMTVVPAQAAGVPEIAVVVPPTPFGGYNDHLLAACFALGVTEVYRIGGAQAVAALAKQRVYGTVDIDSIARPSEVVVIADWTADPRHVASDLISQAEHSPGASILITWDPDLIGRIEEALNDQLARLERGALARDSLERFGALVLARDEDEAVELTNAIAPEHLHIATTEPDSLARRLTNAGAIFLGHDTPVAVGDYAAGPSHVLPTGGTPRWASGLSSNDFLKRTSLIYTTRQGLEELAPDIRRLADVEGLTAHKLSVDIRLHDPDPGPDGEF